MKEIVAVGGSIPVTPTITTLVTGTARVNNYSGIAVDESGDVFFTDAEVGTVYEIQAVGGTVPSSPVISPVVTNLLGAAGIVVDASGNLFVTAPAYNALYEISAVGGSIPASPAINTLGSNFNGPTGVTVDGKGDIFLAEPYPQLVLELEAAAVDFGTVNLGQTSAVIPLTFTFDTAGPIGSPAAVTMGAANLDFAVAGGGTCTASSTWSATQACTVNVTFSPTLAGLRNGAVLLKDGSGKTIATGDVNGIGSGPQVSFLPATWNTVGDGYLNPWGVAVDGDGNVFVADYWANEVKEIPLGCTDVSCLQTLGSGFSYPAAVAVDGSGNVFVADAGHDAVKEILASGGYTTINTLATVAGPWGVAVDGRGNVYVADNGDNTVKEILAMGGSIPASPTIKTLGGGFSSPIGIAVDGNGNVFVSDSNNNAVKEIPPGCVTFACVAQLGGGFSEPAGLALDGNGNVFVADGGNGALKEILAAGGYTTVNTLAIGAIFPSGVAVDGSGNVYYSDNFHLQVIQLNYANAPTLNFGENVTGVASPERTVTLQNIGNSPLTFPIPMAGSNPSISPHFALDSSATTACPLLTTSSAATATLAAGSACNLSVSFDPTAIASFSGSLSVTDNALNAPSPAYTTQIINLQGTGLPKQPQTITFAPIPATPLVTGTVTLTATASSGLPVSYTPATPAIRTVSGNTVTLVAMGNCGILAHQTGNSDYGPAPAVGRNFAVTLATQTITFPAIPSTTLVTGSVTLTTTASSGLGVSYTSATPTICTVAGSTVTLLALGNCGIVASQAGNSDYGAAPAVGHNFAVTLATQTITFPTIPATPPGTGTVSLTATASSGLAVTYTSATPTVCTVSGSTVTLVATGNCGIVAHQAGNFEYYAASAVGRNFTVTAH